MGMLDLHTEHPGSVWIVTDDDGGISSRHAYLPFGEDLNAVAGVDPHRFTGRERDAETGLDYMLARSYAARLGRFVSPDPLRVPDGEIWNLYAYVRNRPLILMDPRGLLYINPSEVPRSAQLPSWIDSEARCYSCFIRGNMTDEEWKEFKQRARNVKKRLDEGNPAVKRYFEARYGASLDVIFTDREGPVVNSGDLNGGTPDGNNTVTLGTYSPATGEITFDFKVIQDMEVGV